MQKLPAEAVQKWKLQTGARTDFCSCGSQLSTWIAESGQFQQLHSASCCRVSYALHPGSYGYLAREGRDSGRLSYEICMCHVGRLRHRLERHAARHRGMLRGRLHVTPAERTMHEISDRATAFHCQRTPSLMLELYIVILLKSRSRIGSGMLFSQHCGLLLVQSPS